MTRRGTTSDNGILVLSVTLLVAAAVVVSACGGPSDTTPRPPNVSPKSSAPCHVVSDLTIVPSADLEFGGYALARVGPLWLSGFGPVRSGKAQISGVVASGWTKVVIHPDQSAHPAIELRGKDCATGNALRFCYLQSPCGVGGIPASDTELERRSDDVVTIPANHLDDYTGYMLFTRSGKYTISVEAGGHLLGEVTLQVG